PQFAVRRTLGAATPKTHNGVTRHTLLIFQAAAPGRRPVRTPKTAHTNPSSLYGSFHLGQPIHSHSISTKIVPQSAIKCKSFLKSGERRRLCSGPAGCFVNEM